jgi:uncharacterized protein YbgA (DUF1722 family)/uncharacterized protein YbbK (DUF523 family)
MKIGVSSCLIGTQCRYDGAGSKDNFIVEELAKYFELVPYCPEAMVFGTPRESIRLVDVEGEIKVISNKEQKDVTKELSDISETLALEAFEDNLCGFVFKAKSPSCGIERVKLYQNNSNMCEKKAVGLFAKAVIEKQPLLPIEEDGRLNDPWLKENFLMQIFAYKDLKEFLDGNPKFKDLVEFHTSYKYLVYAKSQESYKYLGSIVANHDKRDITNVLEEYKVGFLKALGQKGNISKTYNVLLHIFGYFKKLISKEEKEHILTACQEYKDGIIPLIAVIKILNLYVKRFDDSYLKVQKFLNPYPKELALRSNIKAYK